MTDTTAAPTSAESNLLVFPQGIPGFEDRTEYSLFHSDTESGRVYWMETCDEPRIVFTLVEPRLYGLNYTLDLTAEEQRLIQVECADDVMVFLMLWKREASDQDPPSGLNANIGGPILINVEKRLGMQKMLTNPRIEMNIIE